MPANPLAAINSVALAIGRFSSVFEMLDYALARVLEVVETDAASVYLLDADRNELTMSVHRGLSEAAWKDFDHLKLGEGLSGRVVVSSEPIVVRNLKDDPRLTRMAARIEGFQAFAVRGANCVLACWNFLIPYLCPELPERQKEALAYGIKAPLVYTNVLLRNWTSFARLGVSSVSAPGSYHTSLGLSEPVSLGDYRHPLEPDEPMIVDLHRTPCAPGRPRKEQHRLGRTDLLTTTFETFERRIRDQLARTLAGSGFDPGRDIGAITVNRWPHGYTYNYNALWDPVDWALSTPEDRACVVGRQRFGRVAIANADAAGSSHTDAAIDMAYRAVTELVGARPSGSQA